MMVSGPWSYFTSSENLLQDLIIVLTVSFIVIAPINTEKKTQNRTVTSAIMFVVTTDNEQTGGRVSGHTVLRVLHTHLPVIHDQLHPVPVHMSKYSCIDMLIILSPHQNARAQLPQMMNHMTPAPTATSSPRMQPARRARERFLSYLCISFSSPPKAMTVLIELNTSSAMAPALP